MYIFNLVGAKFRPEQAQLAVMMLKRGDRVLLRREPDNPHDQWAIQILDERTNQHLGFVPKHIAASLASQLDDGGNFDCFVRKGEGTKSPVLMVVEEGEAKANSTKLKNDLENSVLRAELDGIDDEVPF